MKTATKDDVKKLASAIENLAKEIQLGIDKGTDVLSTANELVRNNMVLVFALGEVSAVEHINPTKVIPKRYQNYHKKRDANGRFLKKI